MVHFYWIIKDPIPLKTLPTMCCGLLTLGGHLLINNYNYYKTGITDAVCVCMYIFVCVCAYMYVHACVQDSFFIPHVLLSYIHVYNLCNICSLYH